MVLSRPTSKEKLAQGPPKLKRRSTIDASGGTNMNSKLTVPNARSNSLGSQGRRGVAAASAGGAAAAKDHNAKHLEKLQEKKFEDNLLKEIEFKRFHQAKQRLRNFLLYSDMSDMGERQRLLSYFSHRYVSLI